MNEYATAAAIVGVAFAVAETIIRLNKNNSSQCGMHNVVVSNLEKSMTQLTDWMVRLEGKLDLTIAALAKGKAKE